ncbi:hypothetical protein QUF63_03520 [Anaerolineales bacterium HSG25]|nr:hypothetical protein [Anaerolineales bacterium HSG25]
MITHTLQELGDYVARVHVEDIKTGKISDVATLQFTVVDVTSTPTDTPTVISTPSPTHTPTPITPTPRSIKQIDLKVGDTSVTLADEDISLTIDLPTTIVVEQVFDMDNNTIDIASLSCSWSIYPLGKTTSKDKDSCQLLPADYSDNLPSELTEIIVILAIQGNETVFSKNPAPIRLNPTQ